MISETLNVIILKNCIKNGDDLYYWDDEKEALFIYNRNPMPVEKCSPEIIKQLFCILAKERKEAFDSLIKTTDTVIKASEKMIELTDKMLLKEGINLNLQKNYCKQDT